MRHAGLPVKLRVDGDAVPLAPGVDASAYRIVQEALTNALKHAGDAATAVRAALRRRGDALEVLDDGRGAPQAARAGHGLIGMRERVELSAASCTPGRGRRRLRRARAAAARGRRVIRVLIADDQALVRAGLRMILEAQADLEVVGEAEDGRAALDRVASGGRTSS